MLVSGDPLLPQCVEILVNEVLLKCRTDVDILAALTVLSRWIYTFSRVMFSSGRFNALLPKIVKTLMRNMMTGLGAVQNSAATCFYLMLKANFEHDGNVYRLQHLALLSLGELVLRNEKVRFVIIGFIGIIAMQRSA